MNLTIELTPELESSLRAQALAGGLALDAWLQKALEEMAKANKVSVPGSTDLDTALDALARLGTDLSPLPDSALTRASFYEDHG